MTAQRLEGKQALITGATTGIGYATAQRFIAEGAQVVITGQNDERLRSASEALGPAATAVRADVTSLADLAMLGREVKARFGTVDVLFANAGLGVFAPIEDVQEADYDRQFNVNVKGLFFSVQQILPLMQAGASIILTASSVHAKGVGTGSLYFASKAAVRSFARSLAAELGPRGIRVNALSPGIVRTHFSSAVNIPEEAFDGFIDMVVSQAPLGREGTAEDMASAAAFLASDDAAYMTAADLTVDGGWMNV